VGFPHFVVQHHLATADHYDFRLEISGVLVSWAVPKGPSLDPTDRRLALRTDDHAMDYETYEGRLGDRRNGGVVQVWDRGTYRNTSHVGSRPVKAAIALERGHLSFWLDGSKLHGGFSLIRTRSYGGRESWLLTKKADEEAGAGLRPTTTQLESVLSGKTVEQLDVEGA
jgi:DNA ligase D-like protein (predicted 3'-phosphoesterase)